jgi:hypothetical protein
MSRYYKQMEDPGQYTARYPTGSSIGANFMMKLGGSSLGDLLDKLGINQRHMASVTSTGGETKGWACSWDPANPYKSLPLGAFTLYVPNLSCELNRGLHPWWGITPYMSFDNLDVSCADFASEHCQPDVWVALADEGGAQPVDLDLQVQVPGGKARASVGTGKGPKAVARALVYYHRPGTWREPPNFFNPYWHAKLAPVHPGLARLADAASLRALWAGLPDPVLDRSLTH